MRVSVIVITFNEEKNIADCIQSLLAQQYKDKYEIIIVDGNSKDKTGIIVKSFIKKNKQVRLLVRKDCSQTKSRNEGIKNSKYNYVAFTDADCIVPKNWIANLTANLEKYNAKNNKIVGVGGANIPPEQGTEFLKAIGIAFNSWIGSLGSIQAKPLKENKLQFSLSCTNVIYKKDCLFEAGLFTEHKKNLGDDWEMGLKLKQKGYLLLGIKDSFVWHKMRATPQKLWKNMILYGDVRMHFIKNYFKHNSPVYFLPLIFIFGMLSSTLFFVSGFFLLPIMYFPIILAYSLFLCIKNNKIKYTLEVFKIFLILHFGYGLGEIYGLRRFFMKE
jgi:glycosyltransferase involved in cell wall biosynthesis